MDMQWFPAKGNLKTWRKDAMHHVESVCEAREAVVSRLLRSRAACSSAEDCARLNRTIVAQNGTRCCNLDVYEFGVFTGRALKKLVPWLINAKGSRNRVGKGGSRIARHVFGFDSFRGISSDAPSIAGSSTSTWSRRHGFGEGQFSAMSAAGASSVAEAVDAVRKYVGHSDALTLVPGFLNESLTSTLASELDMSPALYVDIDVDIYQATFEALDWMLTHGLIVNGTIIGYDDFNQGLPKDRTFVCAASDSASSEPLEGEPRAHCEIARKWGVQFTAIESVQHTAGMSGWAFTATVPASHSRGRRQRRGHAAARTADMNTRLEHSWRSLTAVRSIA